MRIGPYKASGRITKYWTIGFSVGPYQHQILVWVQAVPGSSNRSNSASQCRVITSFCLQYKQAPYKYYSAYLRLLYPVPDRVQTVPTFGQ